MKEFIAFLVFLAIWVSAGLLQDNVFMIEGNELVMAYGAAASMLGFFIADIIKS